MDSYSNYITRDTAGGAGLANFPGKTLEIDEPGVFSLDILDAPNLEVIHLKRLKPLKRPHLVLSNLPKLQQIILPSGHPGAIVHFNNEKAPRPFVISGVVSEIDAAWENTQLRLESAPNHQHWSRVICCKADNPVPEPAGNGLVILNGTMPTNQDQLTLGPGNDWLLTNIAGLRHVQVNTGGKAVLQQVPDLRTVNSSGHGLTLEVSETPMLKRVSGVGERFTLRQKTQAQRELTIADQWKHACIHSSRLQTLRFPNGASLALHHCNALHNVEVPLDADVECFGALPASLLHSARFYFDESSLNASFERLKDGDTSELPAVLSILAKAYEREQVVLSLQKLHALCKMGVAPDLIWNARRELATRHRDNRAKNKRSNRPFNEAAMSKADLFWHWKFPEDLAPQGWEADLKIWEYCQRSVPAAADYGDIIACTCCDDEALNTLIRLAGNTPGDTGVFRLTLRCMEEYLLKDEDFLLNRNRSQNRDPTMRLVKLLIRPRAGSEGERIVVAFLCNILPLATLVKSIPPIVHLCPGVFRSQLMAMARKPEAWFRARTETLAFYKRGRKLEEYRQRLMQIALAPCTSEDDEEDEEDDELTIDPGTNYTLFQGEA
ncbi:MAG TPA: hypothetical protein DHU56_06805 [Marinobacter sp.]|nr:hypothetical protein [Marinobacter sp.]